jgi:hypothetical protein
VLLQAIEKRLGKGYSTLTGPETSATALATDVLVNELDDLISSSNEITIDSSPDITPPVIPAFIASDGTAIPEEIVRARQARIEAARKLVHGDLASNFDVQESSNDGRFQDPSEEIYFGRGGIKGIGGDDEEDDLFAKGMNPDSFY